MVDNKNKGPGEFDDDAFDAEEFSDADFDESAYDESAEFDELPETEGDYEGDDFEAEEWADEENGQDTGKKNKKSKLPKTGGSKLGFNAMVIIGAVVVGGGVMAYKIVSETKEAKSAQSGFFRSILNIGGIMDGTIFGDKSEETAQTETQTSPLNEGFLNNPGNVPTTPEGAPPQPTPISPVDGAVATGEPLTPMPVQPSNEAPRGPDEMPPTDAPPSIPSQMTAVAPPAPEATPAAPATSPSAEDILKQAMANREQKQQGQEDTATAEGPVDEITPDPTQLPLPESPTAETKGAEAPSPQASAPEASAVPPPQQEVSAAPVEQNPSPAKEAVLPAETQQEIVVNKEAVTALEGRIETLLKRIDQLESDLDTVRESKDNGNTGELEKTVASLRTEIEELKSRPAPASEPASKPLSPKKKTVVQEEPEEEVAIEEQPAPVKKASVPKKAKASRVASTATGTWELRAAQPGRAWVSKPGERDMKAISVGESLSGIGTVSAITYQNGRWTVNGTQGSIYQ